MTRRHAPLACLLIVAATTFAAAATRLETWHDAARNRDVPVKLYLPDKLTADTPVVVFSPGLGGTREGYAYLGDAWSGHGYAVMVLQHVGSDLGHLLDPAAMTAPEYLARMADVRFALDELQRRTADPVDALAGKLDVKRVAMAGHSYGAVTTQACVGQAGLVAGKPFSDADARIVCAILMSPSPPRTATPAAVAFAGVKLPLLHLTGTADAAPIGGITVEQRRIPFDVCPASPQWLVTFDDGDHMVFSGRRAQTAAKAKLYDALHPIIIEATTHFLDATLRGDAAAKGWMKTKLSEAVAAAGVVESK